MVKTKVIEENEEAISILFSDTDRAFVNAIRRSLMADTPKMAIDTVRFEMGTIEQDGEVWETDGPLPDEFVAQRLAMIPLPTKHDEFHFQDSCPSCAELVVEDRGCPQCTMIYTCKEFGSEGGRTVTAGDMSFLGAGGSIAEKYHSIPITKLYRGQMIEFYATAIMGRGRDHSKWSPVCGVTFEEREIGRKNSEVDEYMEEFWNLKLGNDNNDWGGKDTLEDHNLVRGLKDALRHFDEEYRGSPARELLVREIKLPGKRVTRRLSRKQFEEEWELGDGGYELKSSSAKKTKYFSKSEMEDCWSEAEETQSFPIWIETKPGDFILSFETDGSMTARTAFEKAIDELSARFAEIEGDAGALL